MRLALAQVDARLGDFDGICSRIERQLLLAHEVGADLLCVPAPLFCGVTPGTFADYPNYEHDLLRHLQQVAASAEPLGVTCLVPAVLSLEGGQLFEVFMLRRGRVVPLRLTMIRHHDELPVSPWAPPVFEEAGTRIACTFDVMRDIDAMPGGCDLMIHFAVNALDVTDETTANVAAVADGAFSSQVERAGTWLACMAPVGGFDDAVYTGGSFVMDDTGRVVAQAPCFEEHLLVQDIRRGMMVDALPEHELPVFDRNTWLWEGLRLHLRDAVHAAGHRRAVVPFDGDLQSAMLAALTVDALGPRNVLGLLVHHEDAVTPAAELREESRAATARALAEGLRVRLVERTAPDVALVLDRDAVGGGDRAARRQVEAILLADTAREQHALALSPLTKTDAALRANALAPLQAAPLAPFGDVYLSSLEWVARTRRGAAAAIPDALLAPGALCEPYRTVIEDAVLQLGVEGDVAERARTLLCALDPAEIDRALEAHVDRNLPLDELELAHSAPEVAAVLVLLVRRNESGRRMLPIAPVVSARAFSERLWPVQLAWSDFGLRGEERTCAADLAEAEYRRLEKKGGERGMLARSEVMGMLGSLLGLTPEQQRELMSEEGQQRMRADLQELEGNLREAFRRMVEADGENPSSSGGPTGSASPSGFNFFSLN